MFTSPVSRGCVLEEITSSRSKEKWNHPSTIFMALALLEVAIVGDLICSSSCSGASRTSGEDIRRQDTSGSPWSPVPDTNIMAHEAHVHVGVRLSRGDLGSDGGRTHLGLRV
mmetsp:Transcript_81142/g.262928  ORF Transcript_81142/g.262928 Transcript_81142/m.262928 type:complete len:112 (+) Transcript_81142:1216-1551(+)